MVPSTATGITVKARMRKDEEQSAGYVVARKEGAGSRDHSTARQPEEGGGAGLR